MVRGPGCDVPAHDHAHQSVVIDAGRDLGTGVTAVPKHGDPIGVFAHFIHAVGNEEHPHPGRYQAAQHGEHARDFPAGQEDSRLVEHQKPRLRGPAYLVVGGYGPDDGDE